MAWRCSCFSSQFLKPDCALALLFKARNTKPSPILKYVFSYYNAQEKRVKDILGKVAF